MQQPHAGRHGIEVDRHHRRPVLLVELGDGRALAEDAGGEHGDVDAAEALDAPLDGIGLVRRVGDVGRTAEPRWTGERIHDVDRPVDPDHRRTVGEQRRRACTTDPRRRARDDRDLPGEHRRRPAEPELGLLEVPVLEVEQMAGRQRCPPAEPVLARGHDVDRVVVDVRCDLRVPGLHAGGEHPEFGVEHDARRRVEHGDRLHRAVLVLVEVGGVVGDVPFDVAPGAPDQRNAFGPDDVIGRDGAARREGGEVVATDEAHHRFVDVAGHHERPTRRHRQMVPELGEILGADMRRYLCGGYLPLRHRCDVGGGTLDELEVPFVRVGTRAAKREQPVGEQDEPLRAVVGLLVPRCAHRPGEVEPRHHVGHVHDVVTEDLTRQFVAVGHVGDGQHEIGMAVQHRHVRQEGVEQRLDRRLRCGGVEPGRRQFAHHVGVGQRLEVEQRAQAGERHRGEPRPFDRGEIPARPLDVDGVDDLAGDVRPRRLHRRVPAAVKHE